MIGDRIRKLRDEKGISQAELAKVLNVNRMTVNNYETSKRVPDINFAINAADYFGVTVEYLSGRTEFRDKEDIKNSIKKAEKLMEVIEKLPQGESQDMLSYFIELLDIASEYDIEEPIIFGAMNSFLQLKKLVSGYINLEKSIVRDIAELKRQKIIRALIKSACEQKVTALNEQSFDAASALAKIIHTCTNDIQKQLTKVFERELE